MGVHMHATELAAIRFAEQTMPAQWLAIVMVELDASSIPVL
jgi:hypothetical protein